MFPASIESTRLLRAGALAAVFGLLSSCSAAGPSLSDQTSPSQTTEPQANSILGASTLIPPTSLTNGGLVPDPTGDGLSATEPNVGPALALITPTGVVVPVVSETDAEYLVRTPCGNSASLAWGTPIYGAQVVLDPGHGGEVETGAVGDNGLAEKDLNLRLAKRAARLLHDRGISVVLTRTSDYRIPLAIRAEIGDSVGADLMVSIHHNAPNWLPSDTPGTEIFVQKETPESRRLGGLIYEEVVAALRQFEDVEWTSADDAGALEVLNNSGGDTYGMVRRPTMPAVLAEFGYISNPSEAELFATDEYIEVAAEALSQAIWRWLVTSDSGSGFVDEPRIFTPTGGTGGVSGCVDPDLE